MERSKVVEYLSNLTVTEILSLTKELEEKWQVSSAPVFDTGPKITEEVVEEKTEFDVVLTSFNDKKITVVKEVRAITGLGLKEAKELTESAPCNIREAVSKEDADELVKRLVDAGASMELK